MALIVVPGDHAGQIAALLLLAAVMDEIVGDDVGLQREAGRRAHVAQLLADDGVEAEVEAGAAIGLGHLRAEQAGRADLLPRLALDDAVALMGVEPRLDHVGEDAADRVAEGVMVVGEERAVGGFDHGTSLRNRKFAEGKLMKLIAVARSGVWFGAPSAKAKQNMVL